MTSTDVVKFLQKTPPFHTLAEEDLRFLASMVETRSFKKGDILFTEGEPADAAWMLRRGRLQIQKSTPTGKQLTVESLGPGDLFGTLCRLGTAQGPYLCTALGAESGAAWRFPETAFRDLAARRADFLQNLCTLCADRLKNAHTHRVEDREPAPRRLAGQLARLVRRHGPMLPFTKREVAELTGLTTETAFRILGALQKKKVVTSLRGRIRIDDPAALRREAESA